MANLKCCSVIRLIDTVGQSNNVGQGGDVDKPDSLLLGLESAFNDPESAMCYSERIVNLRLLDEQHNNPIVRDIPIFGDIQPYPATPFLGRFGTELFLARYLAFYRPSNWGPQDIVVVRKFGAGGASIQRFLPTDGTGFHALYDEWLDEQDAILADLGCPISHEGTFLIQGEANATQGAANYVPQVDQLMAYLTGRGYSDKLVWPQLREDVNGAQAAQLNANMVASQYYTTVTNNDLPMLPNENHYTALSYKELAKRLYNAYIGYPIL